MSYEHPTGRVPYRVDVVALGATCQAWMRHGLTKGREADPAVSEVWTVNRGIRVFDADVAFVLDEIEPEIRKDPHYGQALKNYKNPIISTVYTDAVPVCVAYPGAEILDCIEKLSGVTDPYWHNSIPMVLAYAWWLGVKNITLWGCDYTLPGGQVLEDDRANLEYWVGYVRARGMRVGVPVESTLLNLSKTKGELRIYGLLDQSQAPAFVGL